MILPLIVQADKKHQDDIIDYIVSEMAQNTFHSIVKNENSIEFYSTEEVEGLHDTFHKLCSQYELQKSNFPIIWIETNSVWGKVESLEQLKDFHKTYLELGGNCNFDNWLQNLELSKHESKNNTFNFGSYSEHNTGKTLFDFLKTLNLI